MNSKKNFVSLVFFIVIFGVQFETFVAIFWEWECFVQNGKACFMLKGKSVLPGAAWCLWSTALETLYPYRNKHETRKYQ